MPDRRFGLLCVVTAALAVTGCTSTDSAQSIVPTTHGGPRSSATAITNDPSTISLPPRPDSYPLNGIDPCELLTPAQLGPLNLRAGARLADDQQFGQPVCSFQVQGEASVSDLVITAVANQGIEFWANPDLADDVKQVTVAGFPALDITAKATAGGACETAISVNDGQMLLIDLGLPPLGTTRQQACASTEKAGAAAVATLQTVK